jgi:cation diffusion facilitator CzcD-associated flavoprotein CzcO
MSDSPRATDNRGGKLVDYDAIVIGAGFGGLYALYKLKKLGLRVLAFEKGEALGGVWYWNQYPGARCDCESYYYSYSFSSELQQEWDWSLRYSRQPEILRYLNHVADRFDLKRHIRFGASVERAAYDEEALRWRVTSSDREVATSRFLISAAGCLSQIHRPDIPGLDGFEGNIWRTADWPRQGVDFTGRRVGIIGTGASGVQAIPQIARQASRLTVFQRTANWVLPARNVATTAEFNEWVKANYDDIREKCLASPGAVPFELARTSALELSEEERRAVYDRLWKTGGMRFFSAFTDLFTNQAANETAQSFVRDRIREVVKDPEVATRLIPTDHPIGVKRPPVDDDYYETFNRPTVELVDIRRQPIAEISGRRVITAGGAYELDDLVLATGFDAMTGALLAIDITGRGGVSLQEKWQEGPASYLGLSVSGFPNFFTVTGPLSPSVLANMPTAVEQHVDWIAACIDHMRREKMEVIEATSEAEEAWGAHNAAVVSQTLYPQANSWYLGANVPGKPRRFGVYVGGFAAYRERCDAIAQGGYEGFRLSAAHAPTSPRG